MFLHTECLDKLWLQGVHLIKLTLLVDKTIGAILGHESLYTCHTIVQFIKRIKQHKWRPLRCQFECYLKFHWQQLSYTIQNMNSQRGEELIMSAKTALSENFLLTMYFLQAPCILINWRLLTIKDINQSWTILYLHNSRWPFICGGKMIQIVLSTSDVNPVSVADYSNKDEWTPCICWWWERLQSEFLRGGHQVGNRMQCRVKLKTIENSKLWNI